LSGKKERKLKRVYEFDLLFFSVIWLFLKDLLNTGITGLLDNKCFFSPFYVFNNCADLSTFFFLSFFRIDIADIYIVYYIVLVVIAVWLII
jgi:hypothetical protein